MQRVVANIKFTWSFIVLLLLNTVDGNDLHTQEQILNSLQQNVNPLETEQMPNISNFNENPKAVSLKLQPEQLEFGDTVIGSTRTLTITLINTNADKTVALSSAIAQNPSFYSNIRQAKVIPPRGNLTIEIGFLPWKEGLSKSKLLIATTLGQAILPVTGIGQENPYRLKPILEIKAPLNSTLSPELHIFNPHDRPLQIMEVFSSGGKFQLELPSGTSEGPQTLWTIPPYTAKPVIRIRFYGMDAGNYTAYIRVKISQLGIDSIPSNENIFVIPIEFEILPQHGLYTENPVIDFGRIIADAKTEMLYFNLQLQNSHKQRQYKLVDVVHNSSLNAGLTYNFKQQRLILNPKLFNHTTCFEELLIFGSCANGNQRQITNFSVIVRGEILKGSLAYDKNLTSFVQSNRNDKLNEPRLISIQNQFDVPMALKNISLQASNDSIIEITILKELEKNNVLVLQPDMRLNLLQLKAKSISQNFQANVRIYTNITLFEIPIFVCSGRLHITTQNIKQFKLDAPYNTELNLGAIPLAELSHEAFILLRNPNSIAVKLNNWDFQSTEGVYFLTTFLGCFNAARNESIAIDAIKFNFCSSINAGEIGVFKVAIQPHITEHQYATLKIWTPYEVITNTIKFFTWVGNLEIDQERINFSNCFPGKICTSELSVHSSFEHPIHLTSIELSEPSFSFIQTKFKNITIAPKANTVLGRISFEPAKLCGNACYIPLDRSQDADMFENSRDSIDTDDLHFDLSELRRRVEKYRQLKWHHKSATITLNSREIQEFDLQFMLDIEWPKLVPTKPNMPTLEVGKSKHIVVEITNPADTSLLVDYFLSNPLLAKQTKFSLPPEVVDISSTCYLTDEFVFDLPNGTPKEPVLIPAGKSLKVPIAFRSPLSGTYCTLLHIRSNLTMYEAVWISGKSVQSQFRLGNRKPGSQHALLFEIGAAQLSGCTERRKTEADNHAMSQVLVKRSFAARNLGDLPIRVSTFYIDNAECVGYGFQVMNCSEFILAANSSKKIDILFKPDFTETKIEKTLTLETNLTYPINYKLVAYLSDANCQRCESLIIQRPFWEERLRFVAIIVLLLSLLLVIVAAHIDYSNMLVAQSTMFNKRDKGAMHPTFNLRNIAVKSNVESEEQNAEQKSRLNTQKASKYNNGSNNFLRKRDTKRYFANGNGITFSERQFKLRQEADRAATVSKSETTTDASEMKQPCRITKFNRTEKDELLLMSQKDKDKQKDKEKESNIKLNGKKMQQSKSGKKLKTTPNQKEEKTKPFDDLSEMKKSKSSAEAKLNQMEKPVGFFSKEMLINSSCAVETEQKASSMPENRKLLVGAVEKINLRINPFDNSDVMHHMADTHNTNINCITSPWETSSHVTFSEIFPTKAKAKLEHKNPNGQLDVTSNCPSSLQSMANVRNMELGPIGSRRSPTSTLPLNTNLFTEFLNSAHYQQPGNSGNNLHDKLHWSVKEHQYTYLPQQHEERHKLLESIDRSSLNTSNNMHRAVDNIAGNWHGNSQQHSQNAQSHSPSPVPGSSHQQRQRQIQEQQNQQQQHALLETDDSFPVNNWRFNNMEFNWTPFNNVPFNYTPPLGGSWLGGGPLRPPPGLENTHQQQAQNTNNIQLEQGNPVKRKSTANLEDANVPHDIHSLWQNSFNKN